MTTTTVALTIMGIGFAAGLILRSLDRKADAKTAQAQAAFAAWVKIKLPLVSWRPSLHATPGPRPSGVRAKLGRMEFPS